MTAPFRPMPGSTRSIFKGAGVTHRHFGGITRTSDGRVHMLHRRASEHGTVAEGCIAYCTLSNEGGGALSAEAVLASPGSGRDLRDCDIGLTPSGRLVAHWTDNPASPVGVGPVYFLSCFSDDGGSTWSAPQVYDTVLFDFARTYGTMKSVPGSSWLVKPGYKQTASGVYRCGLYWSDDDGATWAEGAPIYSGSAAAYNETDVAFIDAFTGFACARSNGLNWSVTRDGGTTWSVFQSIGWASSSDVAPSLNVVTVSGVPFLLLGYVDRSSNQTKWRWARADQLLSTAEAMGQHLKITSAADMISASGYQKPVVYPSGEMLFVEYKEYAAPDKSSDVRLVYGSPMDWIQNEDGAWTPYLKGTTVAGTPTYDAAEGKFTRRGRQVTARMRIDLGSKGGLQGQLAVCGLPFKVAPGYVSRAPVQVSFLMNYSIGSYNSVIGYALEGSNEFRLNMLGSGSLASFTHANFTDDLVLYASVTYETDE